MPGKSNAIQGAAILPVRERPKESQKKTVVWLSLLHYYTGFSGFLAYLFIAKGKIKISGVDFLFLCGLAFLFVFQLFIKDPFATVIDLRFYWGWVIFYFIFKANVIDLKILDNALVVLSVLTLLEAVLINTVIPAPMMPNFPDVPVGTGDYVPPGYYQRPYSFGGGATVGSSLLVVLMAICKVQGWRFWLSVSAVLTFISGAGTLALFLLLLVRYRLRITKTGIYLSLILLLSGLFFTDVMSLAFDRFVQKTGGDYISDAIAFKQWQITEGYKFNGILEYIIGAPDGFRGGDFGFFAFVLSNGFFGLLLFLMLLFSRVNRVNAFPLFIAVITSFHYPVIFFLPGQMIFGWLLSGKKINSDRK